MSRITLVSIAQITLTGCLFASVLTSESTITPPRKRLREAITRPTNTRLAPVAPSSSLRRPCAR